MERLRYRDIITGKIHWTRLVPGRYAVEEVDWLGQLVRAVVVRRAADTLIIPPWAVVSEDRRILTRNSGADDHRNASQDEVGENTAAVCEACGAEIAAEDAVPCDRCGTNYCSSCAAAYLNESQRCDSCGD